VSPSSKEDSHECTVQFLPSIQQGAVVVDRGFNQANLKNAIRKGDALHLHKWAETNPNDCAIDGLIESSGPKRMSISSSSFTALDP